MRAWRPKPREPEMMTPEEKAYARTAQGQMGELAEAWRDLGRAIRRAFREAFGLPR